MKKLLVSVNLRFEKDVVLARQRAREVAELLGFDHSEQIRLATAASEIARNAFRYARGGRVEFLVDTGLSRKLVIKVSDSGPGIPNLDEILEGRYRSTTGMGKGIVGTQRLMDSFNIETGQNGTGVKMTKTLPKYAPDLTAVRLEEIVRKIGQLRSEDPYEEVERQNQELLKTLSELRARQDDLLALNHELEDTNRGVVALNAELEDRAGALRRMSDAKTSFLSNMSHEFRTPLNSILSLSQMLLQRLDGDLNIEQEKQLSYIHGSARDLREMVDDLLDIAKVEAGKAEVKAREFEIEDLFGALRGMLKPIVQTSSVNLVFEEPSDMPTMFTDEGKLSQVLRNFISNALKYTERGEVRVSAKTEGPGSVIFSVADTGIGIDPDNQERIFEEFVQVESRLQKRVKGTGLGLPLCRNLAYLLGGRVTLQSEPGLGSTFSAHIPVMYPGAKTEERVEVPALNPDKMPIVLIEDNRETAYLVSKLLENTEFQIIPAHEVNRGMDFVSRTNPAAVILDLLLDGESSWPALREIRSRQIPVLVISVMDAEQDKAIAMGANAFLPKPLSGDALIKALRSITHRGTVRRILLIDDHELSRYGLRELLGEANVEIAEARTGREGLSLTSKERPDAIFLDLMMPDMTGLEVLRELRASDFGREIPVIIHSSYELSEEQKSSFRLPHTTLLPKRETSEPDALERITRALKSVGFRLETAGTQHA